MNKTLKRLLCGITVLLLLLSFGAAMAEAPATEAPAAEAEAPAAEDTALQPPVLKLKGATVKSPYGYSLIPIKTLTDDDGTKSKVIAIDYAFEGEGAEFVVEFAPAKTPDARTEVARTTETSVYVPADGYTARELVVYVTATTADGTALTASERIVPGRQPVIQSIVSDYYLNFVDFPGWKYLWDGLKKTLIITLLSGVLGILLGVVIAAVRSTYDKTAANARPSLGRKLFGLLDGFCRLYLTVLRGTPVVVQLMIIYFVIFASSNNGTLVASLAFGLNSGAYVAEIVRGGIMSIDNGQFEAGRSLGFNYFQTMRFIVIPQVIKNVLPSLANEFIALLKETSVAGYVAEVDLTKGGDIIRSRTYSPFMPLIAVAAIYLVLVIFFSKLVSLLERRLRRSEH